MHMRWNLSESVLSTDKMENTSYIEDEIVVVA